MIEIIKEPKENKISMPKLPKEVRQIGSIQGYGRIYMEDYIYRFLHEGNSKMQDMTCILMGEDYYQENKGMFFIKGAFCLNDISYAEGLPVFSEDVWDEIYAKVQRYFPEQKILGWSLSRIGIGNAAYQQIERICKRHFTGEHRLVMLMDHEEQEERFYISHRGQLVLDEGYYVYVDRNGAMQDYLTDFHIGVQEKEEQKRPIQNIIATETSDVGHETVARYRQLLQEQDSRRGQGMTRMIAPVAALVLVVLSAVLLQNYMKLQDMEKDVQTLAQEKAKEDVLETISQEVEQNKGMTEQTTQEAAQSTEAAQTTEESQMAEQPQITEEPQTVVNPYLAQGYYMVEEGDRLTAISRKVYGNEDMVDAICEKNGIKNMDHICPGDKLLLP